MGIRLNPRKTQIIAKTVIWSAAILVLVLLFSIIIYILSKGIPTYYMAISNPNSQ